jgi:hypothetical protein
VDPGSAAQPLRGMQDAGCGMQEHLVAEREILGQRCRSRERIDLAAQFAGRLPIIQVFEPFYVHRFRAESISTFDLDFSTLDFSTSRPLDFKTY